MDSFHITPAQVARNALHCAREAVPIPLLWKSLEGDCNTFVAGLAAAKKRGQVLGRKPALSVDDRKRVARLKSNGHSLRTIAGQLECGVATVHRALSTSGVN